jgi:preprotein translocase subunit SecG
MQAVLLTVHALIVLALIAVVLLQRSDGSALGLGGRGAANALTRTTSVLGALFFATSLALAFTADAGQSDQKVIEELTGEAIRDPSQPATTEDLLNTLGRDTPTAPAPAGSVGLPGSTVPVAETPPATLEGTTPPAASAPPAETPAAAPAAEPQPQ